MTSPLRMEFPFERCELVAPGHNLPSNIRLGKLPRTKLAGAWLQSRGNSFILHRACHPTPECGYSYLQSLFAGAAPKPAASSRYCLCKEEYTTHNPDLLGNYLEESGGREIFQVQTEQLGGLIIYVPKLRKYFWLQRSRLEVSQTRCSESMKMVNNGPFPVMWGKDFEYIFEEDVPRNWAMKKLSSTTTEYQLFKF